AYTDALANHPDYLGWLLAHPEFGVQPNGTGGVRIA
ncbi:LysR family transcriptional regulator, partial [Micromonospora chalcea]